MADQMVESMALMLVDQLDDWKVVLRVAWLECA